MMGVPNKPQLRTKAVVYVQLCQGNHVAAAIFDWVLTYTEVETRLRYHEPFYVYVDSVGGHLGNPGPFDDCLGYQVNVDGDLEVRIADLRAVVATQFLFPTEVTDQELFDALDLLKKTSLVSWYTYGEEKNLPDNLFTISTIYLPRINEALTTFYYGHRVTESAPPFDPTRERRIVREQCSRAGRIGQAASLTLEEWIETITHFNIKCAFFSNHPYEVLEHFIPVTWGGGTTVFNCIPACRSCNAIKSDRLPDDLLQTHLGPAFPRIQSYLDLCREQWVQQHSQVYQ